MGKYTKVRELSLKNKREFLEHGIDIYTNWEKQSTATTSICIELEIWAREKKGLKTRIADISYGDMTKAFFPELWKVVKRRLRGDIIIYFGNDELDFCSGRADLLTKLQAKM